MVSVTFIGLRVSHGEQDDQIQFFPSGQTEDNDSIDEASDSDDAVDTLSAKAFSVSDNDDVRRSWQPKGLVLDDDDSIGVASRRNAVSVNNSNDRPTIKKQTSKGMQILLKKFRHESSTSKHF